MKVLTGIKRSDHSKKPERDMSVAFHRLHIAMSPEQLGKWPGYVVGVQEKKNLNLNLFAGSV